jgi:hypothetical protein
MQLRYVLLVALLSAGCGDDNNGLAVKADCNPLGIARCMVPWPSSVYEIDDATAKTGKRLDIPEGALPLNAEGDTTDPTIWNWADGFSPAAPIVVAFPGGVSAQGLPPVNDMAVSLTAQSSTVLIDAMTNQRVAHFAELDEQAAAAPDSQALFIRPAARLVGGHRYIVAITNRVTAKDGSALPRSAGFDALLNGTVTNHARLERMRDKFPALLDTLATAGVPKEDLVLAWDFTVASDEFLHSDMLKARERALAALDTHPITFEIISDTVDDANEIKHTITGKFDAPLFLTNDGRPAARTVISRDAANLPTTSKFYRVPFTAIIPACAYTSAQPVGMILYGHGLMGAANQVASGAVRRTAAELCMVVVGTDMRGMSEPDIGAIARALTNMTYADEVFEVLEQGLMNHITLSKAMRTTFASQLFTIDPDGTGPMPARSLVDPTKVFYYGLSQGGIFGTVVVAYDPFITRGVLGVGGANYSTLLERSTDWPTYRSILIGAYADPLDVTMAIGLFQMRWDKTEGSGVVNSMLDGTALGVPPKQVLMQIALGDDQVPNLGSEWQARSMGIPVLTPTVKMPYGITAQAGPLNGSALVYMDGGAPPPPLTNVPAPNTGAHSLTRVQTATFRQMRDFYTTGMVVNECAGACSCQAGKCD